MMGGVGEHAAGCHRGEQCSTKGLQGGGGNPCSVWPGCL